MAAAIRLARRHEGLTGTNPSVACLIVRDDGRGPVIVGSGVTAPGGRPHAEPLALAGAGSKARGATAYVTLEPCAHHGRTPPCAQTLIDAGIARVVTAVVDPDERVNQRGHAMLRAAGIEVSTGVMEAEAAQGLFAYLTRKRKNRSQVTLKLAVSSDGLIGIAGEGQVAVTGPIARAQSHVLRATHHAILIGAGTAIADDPELSCRLPGLENRSPARIVLDPNGRVPLSGRLVASARSRRTIMVLSGRASPGHREALAAAGCEIVPCEMVDGRIALPELLEDLAAMGILSVLVEGGAATARAFLEEGLVDAIALFEGAAAIGAGIPAARHVVSPLTRDATDPDFAMPDFAMPDFAMVENLVLGADRLIRYQRRGILE